MCGRAGSATQTGTTIASTRFTRLLLQELPVPQETSSRPGQGKQGVPEGYKGRNRGKEDVQQGGEREVRLPHYPGPRDQEAERKRQKQCLLYLHPTKLCKEQSVLHSQGPGWVRHSPRWSGHLLTFKELQTTGPQSPISLLFLTVHKNLISKGAVAPE